MKTGGKGCEGAPAGGTLNNPYRGGPTYVADEKVIGNVLGTLTASDLHADRRPPASREKAKCYKNS